MAASKTRQLTNATSEAVKSFSQTVQSAMNPGEDYDSPDSPSQARTLQYTRRGLKMVGEKSIFDLKEPIWHPDEKVSDSCVITVGKRVIIGLEKFSRGEIMFQKVLPL